MGRQRALERHAHLTNNRNMLHSSRFWCARGDTYSLAVDGYLPDPESEYAWFHEQRSIATKEVLKSPCVALLGEPGIGKSTTLRASIADLRGEIESRGDHMVTFDLSEFGTDDRLERHLSTAFERAPQTGCLHVFLDSLDECRIEIPNVAAMLIGILKRQASSVPRLRLRLACRTADWPVQLENALPELFGQDNYAAYELLPLRRCDVVAAAVNFGIDGIGFLDAVANADAQPLAIKPITLRFLLDTFKRHGSLPKSKAELYRIGCRLLCTEVNDARIDAGHVGTHNTDQRFAVSARIAAIVTLSRHVAIYCGQMPLPSSMDVLPISSFTGGVEQAGDNKLEVDEAAIRDAVSTGLFSSRGPNLLGFSHQTYAEFLTAHYLVEHQLNPSQITSLLCHIGDPERRVVPQLAEVVAWLAGMNKDEFRRVMRTDPHVLLKSDAAVWDDGERESLVAAFLDRLAKEALTDADWSLHSRYGRLSHPRLGEQLRHVLQDMSMNVVARRVAIDIAERAKVTELQGLLTEVACDPHDDYYIRSRAAGAVAEIGDDRHRLELRRFLNAPPCDDPDDQLRGEAMKALWPRRLISIDDMLAALAPPQRRNFAGAYDWFLSNAFAEYLLPAELPTVLAWLRQHQPEGGIETTVGQQRLSDTVVLAAWSHLDDAPTRDALADYALAQLQMHEDILSGIATAAERARLSEDSSGRRKLARNLVHCILDFNSDGFCLVHARMGLIRRDDLGWLIESAVSDPDEKAAIRFARLASWVFDRSNPSDIDQIIIAADKSPTVRNVFGDWLTPVALGTPLAATMKEEHERYQRPLPDRRSREAVDPPMPERIKRLLDAFESGNTEAWCRINYAMLFSASGESFGGDELEDDLRRLPGWGDADAATQHRIVRAGGTYLVEGSPNNHEWLGTNIIYRAAFAGYRAFVLVANEDPDALVAFSPQIWAKWAAIMLGFPVSIGVVGKEQPALGLVSYAYRFAPNETISALVALIDRENESSPSASLFILRKMAQCWDERLCQAMLAKAADPRLKPACTGDLLEHLLERGCCEAREYAESLVPLSSEKSPELRRAASLALLRQASDAGWNVVWPAIQADDDLGHSLMEAISDFDHHTGNLANRLADDQIADLFIWLEHQYPREDDPKHDGAHFVGPRESVAHFRDAVLRVLQGRGSSTSISAIQRICEELPHLDWLRYVLVDSRENMLRRTWVPPAPAQILELCASPESSLVRSPTELVAVLLRALEEINLDLQGETPSAPELWNLPTSARDQTPIRPKDENHLTDWLKRRLKEKVSGRGIVALREVEIRRGEGIAGAKAHGERTDLHVIGIVNGPDNHRFEEVRVIVEVKGCWHDDLQTAMESQLAERYLNDNDCRHGLYVVFWFKCGQWDISDWRNSGTPSWTAAEATGVFVAQAAAVSNDVLEIRSFVLNGALR